MFLDRVINFGETLGDQEKGRSPKKLKSLFEVPNVVQAKDHFFSLNLILHSSSRHVPRPSYPFRLNFGRSGKGSFSDRTRSVS